jgi:septal ring factor EnvC (AmiA/AmiB activator)
MIENCKDCPYIQEHEKRLSKVEDDVKMLNTGQTTLKVQTDTIFTILGEIKSNLQKIADKIETIQLKPANNADKLKWVIVTALCSSSIGALVGFIISK